LLKAGDVAFGLLPGAAMTKVRPGVVVSSDQYLAEHPDVVLGILTTQMPKMTSSSDFVLQDWQLAGLRASSCFRCYFVTVHRSNLTTFGRLSARDWANVQGCIRTAIAL
jgi:mRNA interferase MazF